jgi:hypothetical protein
MHKAAFTTTTLWKWTKKMTTKKKRELRQLDLIFCDVKRFSQLMIPQGPHNEKKNDISLKYLRSSRAIFKFEKKRES